MEKYKLGDNVRLEKVSDKSEKYIFTIIILISSIVLILLCGLNYIFKMYMNEKYCYIIYAVIFIYIVIIMILVSILPKIIKMNFGYYIDENKIEVISGIIFLSQKIVLLKNVYKVIIKKKILGRIFKISSFSLVTSAGTVKIYFLDDEQVEKLYRKIMDRIEK